MRQFTMNVGFISCQPLLTANKHIFFKSSFSSSSSSSSPSSAPSAPSSITPTTYRRQKKTRTTTIQACAEPKDDGEPRYHESWKIYSEPGNKCVICYGEGYSKCLYCFGTGTVRIGPEAERDTISCPQCEGLSKEFCRRCEGSGIRPSFKYVLNESGDGVIKVANLTNEQVNNLPAYSETELANSGQQEQSKEIEKEEKEEEEVATAGA